MLNLIKALLYYFSLDQDKDVKHSKHQWARIGLMFLSCFGLAMSAAAQSGTVKPKYIVVSVIYAPPGSSSSVNYGSSTILGTSTQFDHSFSKGTTIEASVTLGKIKSCLLYTSPSPRDS